MLLQIALWLEVCGFFMTGILVAVMKWSWFEPFRRWAKERSEDSQQRLGIIGTIALDMYWAAWKRVKPDEQMWKRAVAGWKVPFILLRILGAYPFIPIFIVLIPVMVLLLVVPLYTVKLLSGHNVVTNLLISLGTVAMLTGLVIELYLSLSGGGSSPIPFPGID